VVVGSAFGGDLPSHGLKCHTNVVHIVGSVGLNSNIALVDMGALACVICAWVCTELHQKFLVSKGLGMESMVWRLRLQVHIFHDSGLKVLGNTCEINNQSFRVGSGF